MAVLEKSNSLLGLFSLGKKLYFIQNITQLPFSSTELKGAYTEEVGGGMRAVHKIRLWVVEEEPRPPSIIVELLDTQGS